MPPKITRRKDLLSLSEDFEFVEGEHKHLRTVWAVLDNEDVAWRGQKNVRKYYISLPEFEAALERVPDDWLFPEMSPEFTTAPDDGVGEGLYIKRPNITRYDPDIVDDALPSIPRVLLDEIRIMELLTQHPHPNIVRYHGCRVRRGRVTGLVLDRHGTVLDALENDEDFRGSFNKDSIMADIETAVAHLHSLGLAHNDLNPSNVVIGKNKKAILIDFFGSCQPFGKKPMSTGTPGWIDEDFTTSAQEHDLAALPKIKTWLDNVYQGLPTDLPPMPLYGLKHSTRQEKGLL